MVDFRRIDSLRVRAALGNLENIKAHGNAEACGVMVIGNVIGELCDEVDALRVMAARVKELETAIAALKPLHDMVFNDNGDLTITKTPLSYEQIEAGYRAYRALAQE